MVLIEGGLIMHHTEIGRLHAIVDGYWIGGIQAIRVIIVNGRIEGILALIEIEELGIGESSQIIGKFKAVGLLCRKLLVRGDGIQVGEVLRDIGSFPPTVAGHCFRSSPINIGAMLQSRGGMVYSYG